MRVQLRVRMHACHLELKAMSLSDDVIAPGLAIMQQESMLFVVSYTSFLMLFVVSMY